MLHDRHRRTELLLELERLLTEHYILWSSIAAEKDNFSGFGPDSKLF